MGASSDPIDQNRSFNYANDEFEIRGENRKAGRYIEIKARTADKELPPGFDLATLFSFSVMNGRLCQWRAAVEIDITGAEKLTLFSAEINTTNFYAPFFLSPFNGSRNEEIFFAIHKFFLEKPETSPTVIRMFIMLWASSGKDFDARALLLGIAIEGLAKSVHFETPEKSEFEEFKERVLTAMQPYLDGTEQIATLTAEDVARVMGKLGTDGGLSARENIELACKSIGFAITKDQLDAWAEIRNRRGHGKFEFYPSSDDWHYYMVCVDVFNKMCFHIMGFTDPKSFRRWVMPLTTEAAEAMKERLREKKKQTKKNKKISKKTNKLQHNTTITDGRSGSGCLSNE